LSLAGDAMVPAMLWLAHEHPVAFFIVLAIVIVISLVVIVTLFRFLRGFLRRLRGHFAPAVYESA
jgi:heme/copper-type cytochrome/quinol oxidase subunit 2